MYIIPLELNDIVMMVSCVDGYKSGLCCPRAITSPVHYDVLIILITLLPLLVATRKCLMRSQSFMTV